MKETIIDLRLRHKAYGKGRRSITISSLEDFHLKVTEGEKVAIIGESGVGKSTLLNILGLIDVNYSGTYTFQGREMGSLSESELAILRNKSLGFVLQESALINSLSIADNITLPFLYSQPRVKEWRERLDSVVDSLGISHILNKKPLECSGGEKARAILARGIILHPQVILADEPTASLDPENRERTLNLLSELNEAHGVTVITVTHDPYVADRHDRVLQLLRKD